LTGWFHRKRRAESGPPWRVDGSLQDNLATLLKVRVEEIVSFPPGLEVGDRVLYRLTEGHAARRKSQAAGDLGRWKERMDEFAKRTGAREVNVTPRSKGTLPATVDILGKLTVDTPIEDYAVGGALLPSPDWDVGWLLGAHFTVEEWRLFLVDFLDPKVKVFFCHSFPREGPPGRGGGSERAVRSLRAASTWRISQSKRDDIEWARLVMLEGNGRVAVFSGDLNRSDLTVD